jgi:hypothetical protein
MVLLLQIILRLNRERAEIIIPPVQPEEGVLDLSFIAADR